jgi:hypothetical protein
LGRITAFLLAFAKDCRQALDHFCLGNPLVSADQAWPNAIANETTIMQAKTKFRFMKFSSKTHVMAPS